MIDYIDSYITTEENQVKWNNTLDIENSVIANQGASGAEKWKGSGRYLSLFCFPGMSQSHIQFSFWPRHGKGGFLPARESGIRFPIVM